MRGKLKSLRKEQNLTQESLSNKCKHTQNLITQ